jgi:hypothetical protein
VISPILNFWGNAFALSRRFLFFHPKRERPSVDTLGKTPTFSGKEQPGRVMLFWLQMSLYLDGIYRLICEERAANLSINALDPHNCVHRRYRSYRVHMEKRKEWRILVSVIDLSDEQLNQELRDMQ